MADNPQHLAQKIMQLMNAGQFAAAAKAAKTATRKFPREGHFANMVGMALAQSGNPRDAVGFFTKALKLKPGDADIQNNLIQSLVSCGQTAKANSLIDKLLVKRGSSAILWHFKAVSYAQLAQPEKVLEYASNAIEADPKMALAFNMRGIANSDLGNDLDAVADFEKSHALNPKDPDPLANAGLPLSRLDRNEEAMEVVEKALALHPGHINALHRHAVLLAELGRVEESIAQYNALLRTDPLHGEAYSELIKTQPAADNAKLEPQLRSAIAKVPKKSPSQIFLNLGMGNLLYQQKEFEKAAKFLATSNTLAAQSRPYDAAKAEDEFEQIKSLFPVGDEIPAVGDTALPRPIFVVGQPRSGTTLTEMILSAHPDVTSCGELPIAGRLSPDVLQSDAPFEAAQYAKDFRGRLPALPDGTQAFVDKMPANYRYVGFLLHAFPEAPIIHIERDPRDVALSMWRSFFPSGWMNFTFGLKSMAHSANLYKHYMNHWKTVYGDRIVTLDYRDIVSDVDAASHTLASACALDWVEDMASPERNTARVRTASVVQVREGVHTKSVGGWRVMEKHLQPFTDALDPDLWPEIADKG
ncbi:TPR repeat-containing protein YrrB [Shimia thalassica]|uniref:TPR repeat-containing protein YrrB n=1 Tax=Shimia thalassica TaxID=1715693 RepID=A0A0P1I4S7_9RHOB|nr:tetratricopeptide repeat-containing sulfotransferase family protein [Shimia thalassica]CUJ90067.1 TPR repeat-containing protein YrrB [Shimia thalassica]